MAPRFFTVAEANAMLPTLRPLVAEILAARQRILDAQPQLWPVLEKAARNGGSPLATTVLADFDRVRRNLKAIEAEGVQVKDPNVGLLDFLSERDGRTVYLCWRYDEPAVGFWHDLEAGFTGRQPL